MYSRLTYIFVIGFLSGYARSDCDGIQWVNINNFNDGSKPFLGGREGDLSLYHCRVTHQGNIVTGKAIVQGNFRSCWIPADGKEFEYFNNFEILTNPNGANLKYIATSSGQSIPAESLVAGRNAYGNLIHMSRGYIDNKQILGKVDNGYAYLSYYGTERFAQNYEILTCSGATNQGDSNGHPNEHEMRIVNKCSFSIQVGVRGDDFTPENGGFKMNAGENKSVWVPRGWTSGRIWGKTNCGSNNCCETGDCGTCKLQCGGLTGTPDVTLAEFGLDKWGDQDYYDVSLVDAFNLQMTIEPIPGTFQTSQFGNQKYDCQVASCLHDIKVDCPDELRKIVNGKTVACLSACTKFGSQDYCCPGGGPFGTPQTCRSSNYASHFKSRCPLAYSYAYDDEKSTFTCRGTGNRLTGYITTFCP